ncbi:MAG: TonB-dependent receptor plug domain-containing protein [Verrucomicrobiota bacterium]
MPTPTTPAGRAARLLPLALALAAASPLRAQSAPGTPPAAPAPAVVELSPFEVNTSRDVGYAAENTLAGSRLNARLRDTAGSVSVFTKEFLDDLAITDLQGVLDYTMNSELDTNAWQAGNGQNPTISGENLLTRTSVRGLAASQGMDYFMSITNMDPYRVGRFEDTRGPNSILFGVGAPGGLLNQTSKTASLARNSGTLRHGAGSWSRSRTEFDLNRVLVRDRLALSVAAVHQENGGWRQFDFQDKNRAFAAVLVRPVRSLTLQAMGEQGRDSGGVQKTMPPMDEFLAW